MIFVGLGCIEGMEPAHAMECIGCLVQAQGLIWCKCRSKCVLKSWNFVLNQTFANLRSAEQVPTCQTTADACASLNGVQVMSGEIKSSSDPSDASFKQLALLLTDFFAPTWPRQWPSHGNWPSSQQWQNQDPNSWAGERAGWEVQDSNDMQSVQHWLVPSATDRRWGKDLKPQANFNFPVQVAWWDCQGLAWHGLGRHGELLQELRGSGHASVVEVEDAVQGQQLWQL